MEQYIQYYVHGVMNPQIHKSNLHTTWDWLHLGSQNTRYTLNFITFAWSKMLEHLRFWLKKIIASIKRYIVYDGWVHHHSKIQISIHTSRVAERKLWNLTPRQSIFTVSSFALKLQITEHTAVKFAVSFEANFFFSLLKISPWNARNKIQFDFSQSVQFHSLIHSYLWWACFCWKRKNRFVRTNWSSFSSSSPNGNGKWLIEKYKNTESQHCLSGHRRTSHLLKLRYDGCFMPIV